MKLSNFSKKNLSATFCALFCAIAIASCGKQEEKLIPEQNIDNFIANYTPDELTNIKADYEHIRALVKKGKKATSSNKRIYIATVGAPGSCKSTALETFLHNNPAFLQNCLYIDPDQRALKFMTNTYWQSMTCYQASQNASYQACARKAYEKWRGASNYITNNLLNEAYSEGCSIAHGTTSQSPHVAQLYERLKKKQYKIVLIICLSKTETRAQAVAHREETQGFVQSTYQDFHEKEKTIFKNFPTYVKYADTIHLQWVDEFSKPAIAVATLNRKDNKWAIEEKRYEYMNNIKEIYNSNKAEGMPAFEELFS